MTKITYDVVVIGGGIHGVGVAQAAAAEGYSVLLLEKSSLAGGTSSRSSKLIHGGLRYLEHGQFGLVRECLHERDILVKIAPELVRLRPFYIPIYRKSTRNRFTVRLGLSLYALMAGAGREARFKCLSRDRWDALDGLQTHDLQAVFQYHDAQTNDIALTHAVMSSAQSLGADLLVNTEFIGATLTNERCELRFRREGMEHICHSRVIVNASGPWVNHVLSRMGKTVNHLDVDLVQGSHVLLPGRLSHGIYYLESPFDRRPLFAIPWKKDDRDVVLVGTTETYFKGNPDEVRPLVEEKQYLQDAYFHYFPKAREGVGGSHIIDSFSGLRVLPKEKDSNGGAPASRSRDTILHPDRRHRPRLISIYGGKLTAYRATAEKVIALLRASLPERKFVAKTQELPLEPVAGNREA